MAYINCSTLLNTVGTLLKLIWALLFIIMHLEPASGIHFIPDHAVYFWTTVNEMLPWAWQEREMGHVPESEAQTHPKLYPLELKLPLESSLVRFSLIFKNFRAG